MKNFRPLFLLLLTVAVIASSPGYSQVHCELVQANNSTSAAHTMRGGKFGKGTLLMTWGLSGLGFYSIYKASKGA